MVKVFLPLMLTLSLSALQLSIQSGKEEKAPYSTIHLKDDRPFLCEEQKNDFDQTIEIVCVFDRKPSSDFAPLNNNFFTVTSQTREENYFIVVTPHQRMRLIPVLFDLARETMLYDAKTVSAKHWMIVGYVEELPMFQPSVTPAQGLNLPVDIPRYATPYVEGLDIKGNPVRLSKVKDVSDYITIKRLYAAGSYEETLNLVNDSIANSENNVFDSELLLYQLRCFHHLGESENIVNAAKKFIRLYSYDENLPEVLAYIANAYSRIGQSTDSEYFFDRLFSEHKDHRFAQLGLIYKAEQMSAAGKGKSAMEYYDKALKQTTDIDIASTAAFSMAKYYSETGRSSEAQAYIEKILTGNPGYFAEHTAEAQEIAMAFADRNDKLTAARIAGAVLPGLVPKSDQHEEVLKNQGVWLAETEEKAKAVDVLNTYLRDYIAGDYIDEVQRSKDGLFFEGDDRNFSERLTSYDELLERYKGDSIATKALYQKAKLYFENGYYQEVLDMNDSLAALDTVTYPEALDVVKDAAFKLMERSLEEQACMQVIDLAQRYAIELSEKWDEGLFECAVMGGNYALAKEVASRHLKEPEVADRIRWLFSYIKTDFATGNYSEVVDAAREMITLVEVEGAREYDDVYRYAFDAAQRLGSEEEMLTRITQIEKRFGVDYADIERYTQMVTLGQEKKDDPLIESYARKVMGLQKQSKSFTQSPYIEFTLYQALMNLNKDDDALQVMRSLDQRALSDEQRARQKYQMASLLQKSGDTSDAKAAYAAARDAAPETAWGKLAGDALELLQ